MVWIWREKGLLTDTDFSHWFSQEKERENNLWKFAKWKWHLWEPVWSNLKIGLSCENLTNPYVLTVFPVEGLLNRVPFYETMCRQWPYMYPAQLRRKESGVKIGIEHYYNIKYPKQNQPFSIVYSGGHTSSKHIYWAIKNWTEKQAKTPFQGYFFPETRAQQILVIASQQKICIKSSSKSRQLSASLGRPFTVTNLSSS